MGSPARGGARVDVAREMTALTYDIISRTVFCHEIETPPDVMGEAITTYFEALGRIDLWDVLPLPRWLPRPAFIRARPAQKIFRDEVLRLFERRRARIAAGESVPDDLVTRLIARARSGDRRAARPMRWSTTTSSPSSAPATRPPRTRWPGRCSCSRSFPTRMRASRRRRGP